MEVLGALVARDRRSGRPAFLVGGTTRSISYRDFCTSAYKAGNVLRYLGVREGATVVIAGSVGSHPLWAFYGAAQLGAVTRFVDFGADADERLQTCDARVLLLPVDREESVEPDPGTKLATYGGPPTRATTLHWEKELWSENPAVHPTAVAPSDPLLHTDSDPHSHREALEAATAVVERFSLDAESTVVVRGPLSDPHVVVAGLVAPILAGGAVVAPEDTPPVDAAAGDVAVVGTDADVVPERQVCRPDDVPL